MSESKLTRRDADDEELVEELKAAGDDDDDDDDDVDHIWQVGEIRLGVLSGLLLLAGFLVGRAGQPGWELALSAAALVAGGVTFIPETFQKLFRGKIGVDLLMTIGAIGAVALGQVEEAATLAFLYSLAEGLEEYSVAKTRQGPARPARPGTARGHRAPRRQRGCGRPCGVGGR